MGNLLHASKPLDCCLTFGQTAVLICKFDLVFVITEFGRTDGTLTHKLYSDSLKMN